MSLKSPIWFKKWLKQPPAVQSLIFNYAVYLVILIASTLFVYIRLKMIR